MALPDCRHAKGTDGMFGEKVLHTDTQTHARIFYLCFFSSSVGMKEDNDKAKVIYISFLIELNSDFSRMKLTKNLTPQKLISL